MRMRPLLLVIVLFFYLSCSAFGGTRELARPLTFSVPKFKIEELSADLHSDGKIIEVRGKVRNLSHSVTKGFVTIYFKNKNQDVINAVEAEVNKMRPFRHGRTGFFGATANIENMPGVENVTVEFVER